MDNEELLKRIARAFQMLDDRLEEIQTTLWEIEERIPDPQAGARIAAALGRDD